MRKSYLISAFYGTKARKAHTSDLQDVISEVEEAFAPHEYIFIHEDGKCIYDGYVRDFTK